MADTLMRETPANALEAAQENYLTTDNLDASNKEKIAEAASLGLIVRYPSPNELQLDFDTQQQFDEFISMQYEILKRFFGVLEGPEVVVSKSGLPHRHVYIKMAKAMSIWQRVALQACLGSDIRREMLNAVRVANGVDNPMYLIEKGQVLLEYKPIEEAF